MEIAIPDEQLSPQEEMPKVINVTRVISYTVSEVAEVLAEVCDCEPSDVTLVDVIEKIEEWAGEYFGNTRDLIFTDENGVEL